MYQRYNQLRSLLRGHERSIVEYILGTAALFVLSLLVIRVYVDHYGLDERAARGITSCTMFVPAIPTMIAVWRKRRLMLARSAGKLTLQRIGMTIIPQMVYVALVWVAGLPYFSVQLGIAVGWGLLIALPLNYLLCNGWSLKETDKA